MLGKSTEGGKRSQQQQRNYPGDKCAKIRKYDWNKKETVRQIIRKTDNKGYSVSMARQTEVRLRKYRKALLYSELLCDSDLFLSYLDISLSCWNSNKHWHFQEMSSLIKRKK
uniref:Bm13150 n=1 Tax=Brugia malayi TaxID=6279 RepID=A0A1I9G3V9_BRUMA|nr:Bm13150 [Brugia malayi]